MSTVSMRLAFGCLVAVVLIAAPLPIAAQSITGTIEGVVRDNQNLAVPAATVTIRNVDTNVSRSVVTDADGVYRLLNMPVGNYEMSVELTGFSRYVRSGLTLALNQTAVVNVEIRPAAVTEVIEVRADAPLINTHERRGRRPVRHDARRRAAGHRQPEYLHARAVGPRRQRDRQRTDQLLRPAESRRTISSNGARLRSNNIMIDGQDVNDPSVTGRQQPINNTDIVQEIRLITNQFAAEFGRAAGSVMNVVTKSGTNAFDGSVFWFHNDNSLNTRSNLDKAAGRTDAPVPGREPGWRDHRRSSRPRPDVLLRLLPALDRPAARRRVHARPERRAKPGARCCSPPPATSRRSRRC